MPLDILLLIYGWSCSWCWFDFRWSTLPYLPKQMHSISEKNTTSTLEHVLVKTVTGTMALESHMDPTQVSTSSHDRNSKLRGPWQLSLKYLKSNVNSPNQRFFYLCLSSSFIGTNICKRFIFPKQLLKRNMIHLLTSSKSSPN